jgi:hypothetical protein
MPAGACRLVLGHVKESGNMALSRINFAENAQSKLEFQHGVVFLHLMPVKRSARHGLQYGQDRPSANFSNDFSPTARKEFPPQAP